MEGLFKSSFIVVINMSITASFVIAFVLLARQILNKAPKIFSYSLWAVVLFRLICPISFSSTLSFLSFLKADNMQHISSSALSVEKHVNKTYSEISNNNVDREYNLGDNLHQFKNATINLPNISQASEGDNQLEKLLLFFSVVWIIGIILLLAYSIVSYVKLKRSIKTAMLLKKNIFECENISAPFVMGILRPKVYLPLNIAETKRIYILKHEQIHIRRFDYIVKPLAFIALCAHWFNPFVWISFFLMNKDMEMSCDERVIKEMGAEIKKEYSSSLLSFASNKRVLNGNILAFVESNAKSRIKNILNYRKPAFWAVALAIAGVVTCSIGLMADPQDDKKNAANNRVVSKLSVISVARAAKWHNGPLVLRNNDAGATIILGTEFGTWLNGQKAAWKKYSKAFSYKGVPTFTVYMDASNGQEVCFYKSNQQLAKVSYNKKYQYYKIPNATYDYIAMMFYSRSYFMPNSVVKAIKDGKITNKKSLKAVPEVDKYKKIKVGNDIYYLYEKDRKYYCELPHKFISEISEEIYNEAIKFAEAISEADDNKNSSEVTKLVEADIRKIVSAPKVYSNPQDYIEANADAYNDIQKRGDEALNYMLSQFSKGDFDGLRGQIMMRLCKELLGARNNVTDETLSPKEWFKAFKIRRKVELNDFKYRGRDKIEKLVYATELEKHKGSDGSFTIIVPHIFGTYEEKNELKVVVTTMDIEYILYDKVLCESGGSVVPTAITYIKEANGSYKLKEYQQASDGALFASSIEKFCVMPISGKKINGLLNKILNACGKDKYINELERKNLIEHLKLHKKFGVSLYKDNYPNKPILTPLT